MLESVFANGINGAGSVLLCIVLAMGLGVLSAWIFGRLTNCSRSFASSLAILPLIACTVILVVNGNLGAGLAVAGSFSLIRFRSIAGSAREILAVFFAMALGMCLGAGFIGVACVLLVCYTALSVLVRFVPLGTNAEQERELRISVPEALEYENMFDSILNEHSKQWSFIRVRTAEMGSVYQLTYRITLNGMADSRRLLDEIRIRNGNLPVSLGYPQTEKEI